MQEAGCGARGSLQRCSKQGAVHGLGVPRSELLADQLHWPTCKSLTPALCFGFAVDGGGGAFYRIHGEPETLRAMGHGDWQTFVNHYKQEVSLERALDFFTIAPGGKSCAPPKVIRVA